MTPEAKAFEAADAARNGAREIDMVLAIGALQAGDDEAVQRDIAAVVAAARPWPVKVILETALLDDEQKVRACRLARAAGAAFVKTSTGFGGGGATEADVALLRRTVGDALSVKASGGIRTAEDAMRMLRAGADRIGASASVAIVTERPSL
jgi:deoxyribose-phosphate aldolase